MLNSETEKRISVAYIITDRITLGRVVRLRGNLGLDGSWLKNAETVHMFSFAGFCITKVNREEEEVGM